MKTDERGVLVVAGPLAGREMAFRAYLSRSGYAPRSARELVRVMARASDWLEGRGLTVSELTPPRAAELEAALPGAGRLLRFLREAGEVPAPGSPGDATPAEALLAQFGDWLAGERGLSAATVRCYGKQARKFLAFLPGPLDAALRQLDAGQVTSFMLGYCRGRNPESAKAMVTAARALLRFLHVAGYVPVPLAAAVPAVAGWRLASLPRGLDAAVVSRLLGSCDRGTIVGRRDYAVLIMLARLGLRGAEVAALQLADVDWRGGEVAIRPEGQPGRAAAAARRGRRGGRCLPDRRQATVRRANCVLHRPRPVSAAHAGGDTRDHGPGLPAGRPGPGGSPPAAALAGHRDAACGSVAA